MNNKYNRSISEKQIHPLSNDSQNKLQLLCQQSLLTCSNIHNDLNQLSDNIQSAHIYDHKLINKTNQKGNMLSQQLQELMMGIQFLQECFEINKCLENEVNQYSYKQLSHKNELQEEIKQINQSFKTFSNSLKQYFCRPQPILDDVQIKENQIIIDQEHQIGVLRDKQLQQQHLIENLQFEIQRKDKIIFQQQKVIEQYCGHKYIYF